VNLGYIIILALLLAGLLALRVAIHLILRRTRPTYDHHGTKNPLL